MSLVAIDARESGTSTGRYIDKLIENLNEINPGHKVIVLTKKHRIEFIKSIAPNFEVVECNYKEFTFSEQLGFWRQLHHLNADLVHFGMVQQPIFYQGRTVTTMHDLTTARYRNPAKNWLVFTIKQMVYKRINSIIAHKTDAVITGTDFVKDDVSKFAGINSSKITVTYEAADKIKDKSEPIENLEDTKFIMYVGRPQPHKNLERLVQAYKLLKDNHPELKLVFAGKKDVLYKRLERFAKKQGVEDVIFAGFVSEGQLRWLYENTAAYVFPSLSEGFGLPGLEAMMHNAPVVSSDATCLPEVYGDAVKYFDPTDVEDMAASINDLLTKSALRKSLVDKGSKQAAKYSWRRMAEQTLAIYNDVLNK
jgi:glycosyltransferase involved in cell wall biosynthesis